MGFKGCNREERVITERGQEKMLEELVEEIRELIYGEIGPLWKRTAQGEVKKVIRLVLSAIHDGLELPGEKWRAYVSRRYIERPRDDRQGGIIDGSLSISQEEWTDGLYIHLSPPRLSALDALLQGEGEDEHKAT